MSSYRLDVPELCRLLDAQRARRGLSWRDLAAQLDLSGSTFSRLRNGHAPDAHGLVTLLVWLDLDAELACVVKPGDAP